MQITDTERKEAVMEIANKRKNIYLILTMEIILVFTIILALIGEDIFRAYDETKISDELTSDRVSEIQKTLCENNNEAAIKLQEKMFNSENAWYDEDNELWNIQCIIYTSKNVDESFIKEALGEDIEQRTGISDYINYGFIGDYYFSSIEGDGYIEWYVSICSGVSPEDQQLITSTAQEIADKAVGSDTEKIRTITKEIGEMLTYEVIDGDNLATVIRGGKGCCRHYADLFFLACTYAGIDSRIVRGSSYNEGHAWNIVEVDGRWYHVDPTWEDVQNETWVLLGSETIKETRELYPEYEVINEIYDISEEDYAA